VQDSTESAQLNEIAKENVATAILNDTHSFGSRVFPLRAEARRSYESIELQNLEPLDPNHGSDDYEALLPLLKQFFYLETKLINAQTFPREFGSNNNETEKSMRSLKSHLVSSYYLLAAQETSLKATTLTSLVENSICSITSAALGILVYVEGSSEWTTITSFVLFGLCFLYKVSDYAAYIGGAWFAINETEYKRLVMEAQGALRKRSKRVEDAHR
jgi:hypothetical protein